MNAEEILVRVTLRRYREGKLGMRDAAKFTGKTVAEMMAKANERGVPTNYNEADLESDAESLV